MIVLTGGAGFIGSCILAELNKRGRNDILVVDALEENDPKAKNLENKNYEKFFDKQDFLELLQQGQLTEGITDFIHMGACSSTTLEDPQYYQENNYEYSVCCAKWALKHKVRFIYASSAATYGDGQLGYSDDETILSKLQPLNFYGESKHQFDLWVLNNGYADKIVGLKFFNVFGPNEYHKGDMRSVIAKTYQRAVKEGKIALFKSYRAEYPDGEQKRDFIYVKDAVDVVMYFFDHSQVKGIYNVGTGEARSWNDLARAIFTALGKPPQIEYCDMPESIKKRYQYFTQADMNKLRQSGYTKIFTSLEDAVADYASYLKKQSYL